MKFPHHRLLLLVAFLCSRLLVMAQTPPPSVPPPATAVIPPSPNVQAMQKYGDIPVSAYTGVPNISIPLYTIKFHDISVPISISYHASGIKVAEEASQVGLGWVLNAGGSISRKIVGMDDFISGVYFNTTTSTTTDLTNSYQPLSPIIDGPILNANHTNSVDFTSDLSGSPKKDLQPDEFYYNVQGLSGRFLLKRTYETVLRKLEKIDITCLANPQGVKDGSVWQIKSIDGFIYDFTQIETAKDPNGNAPSITAIYLTQITSPTHNIVTFHYIQNGLSGNYVNPIGSHTDTRNDGILPIANNVKNYIPHSLGTFSTNGQGKNYSTVSLDYIDFGTGRVQFNYTNTRTDVPFDNQLNSISVFTKDVQGNLASTALKNFNFSYSYFIGAVSGYTFGGTNSSSTTYTQRLQLNSITETGNYNGQNLTANPYTFQYYTGGANTLPSKDSYARDHWGYYNGMTTNTSLIPSFTRGTSSDQIKYYMGIPGMERNSNGLYMQAFSLSDIKYPTGGTTHFDYEANDCDEQKSQINDQSGNPYPYTIFTSKNAPYTVTWHSTTPNAVLPVLDMSDEYRDPTDGMIQGYVNIAFRTSQNIVTPTMVSSSPNQAYVQFTNTITGTISTIDPATCGYMSVDGGGNILINNMPFGLLPGKYNVSCHVVTTGGYSQYIMDINSGAITWFTQVNSTPDPNSTNPTTYSPVGGLRIKRITDFDGINSPKIKRYIYHYTAGNLEYSYGRRMSIPQYSYWEVSEDLWFQRVGSQVQQDTYNPVHLMRNSDSNIPLTGAASGSAVGYDQVIVYNGENGENGKTAYQFHNNPDIVAPYLYVGYPSRRPYSSNVEDPLNGSVTEETDYAVLNEKFVHVKDIKNIYISNSALENDIYAIEDHILPHFTTNSDNSSDPGTVPYSYIGPTYDPGASFDHLLYTYSAIQSVWTYLSSTDETIYSLTDQTKLLETVTNYYYDNSNHYLPTRTVATDSKGQIVTSSISYPLDYNALNNVEAISQGIQNLITNHVLNVPVEKMIKKTESDGTNGRIVSASIYRYDTALPALKEVYQMQSGIPVPVANFTKLSINSTSTSKDASYQPVQWFDTYDANNGNLLQQHKDQDINTSYQWGYNKVYPVAQCKNAASNEFYYEGFEENTTSIAGGHTGTKCASSFTVNWTRPNSRAYVMTYWYLTGGGWVLSPEQPYTGNVSLTGGTAYDDIRIFPADAELTTYTYDKLVGLTSTTDPKGMVTYYEYDGLQRLMNIKDKDGNIVKNYQYHFQPQVQ
jgi:YD repeat-containing protein